MERDVIIRERERIQKRIKRRKAREWERASEPVRQTSRHTEEKYAMEPDKTAIIH